VNGSLVNGLEAFVELILRDSNGDVVLEIEKILVFFFRVYRGVLILALFTLRAF
jgi:hypothetical protein